MIKSNGGLEDAWYDVSSNFDNYTVKNFNKKCEELGVPIVLELKHKHPDYVGDEGGWRGHYVFTLNGDLFRMDDGWYDSWGGDRQDPFDFEPAVAKQKTITVYEFGEEGSNYAINQLNNIQDDEDSWGDSWE